VVKVACPNFNGLTAGRTDRLTYGQTDGWVTAYTMYDVAR